MFKIQTRLACLWDVDPMATNKDKSTQSEIVPLSATPQEMVRRPPTKLPPKEERKIRSRIMLIR